MDCAFPNRWLPRILPILIPRLEGKEGLPGLLVPVAQEEGEIISRTLSMPVALQSRVSAGGGVSVPCRAKSPLASQPHAAQAEPIFPALPAVQVLGQGWMELRWKRRSCMASQHPSGTASPAPSAAGEDGDAGSLHLPLACLPIPGDTPQPTGQGPWATTALAGGVPPRAQGRLHSHGTRVRAAPGERSVAPLRAQPPASEASLVPPIKKKKLLGERERRQGKSEVLRQRFFHSYVVY